MILNTKEIIDHIISSFKEGSMSCTFWCFLNLGVIKLNVIILGEKIPFLMLHSKKEMVWLVAVVEVIQWRTRN